MVILALGSPTVPRPFSMPTEVSIILLERQALYAAALSRLLTESFPGAQVTTVPRSDQFLGLLDSTHANLLICEAGARPISGVEVTRQLKASGNALPVVLLGEPADEDLLIEGLRAGCDGALLKSCTVREFVEGITVVLAGWRAIGDKMSARLLLANPDPSLQVPEAIASKLSSTELAVLSMIGGAKSVTAIAIERGISEKTVRNHLANIYRKLKLRNRPEAVLLAARLGLTDSPSDGVYLTLGGPPGLTPVPSVGATR